MRRSFARGSLADWAGWLLAREFASRSGAMNLEQVGPLDIHLLCRFSARPPSLSCSHSCCISRFLRVRSPLPSSSSSLALPTAIPSLPSANHATLFLFYPPIFTRPFVATCIRSVHFCARSASSLSFFLHQRFLFSETKNIYRTNTFAKLTIRRDRLSQFLLSDFWKKVDV